jgi:hypothetical protein
MIKPPKEIQENPEIDLDEKTVLSQDSVDETETNEEVSPEKKAEKQKNVDGYHLRQERKRWKQEVEKARRVQITEEDLDAAMNLAKSKGFDLEDQKEKDQIRLIVEAADLIQSRKEARSSDATNKTLEKVSRENLSKTLEDLGYRSGTRGFLNAGQACFSRFGIDDPDVFLDSDRVREAIEDYASSLAPAKKQDDLEEALIKKSSGQGGASQSRLASSSGKSSGSGEVKREAERLRISESVAAELLEKKKNLPSFAR